jgi:hypothetical protein
MRTTIYINSILAERIKESAISLDISCNYLIKLLIHEAVLKDRFQVKTFQGVKYQDRDPEKKWKRLHVSFEPHIYEMGLDLRKALKCSVSLIVSFAIIQYLDELIEKLKNNRKVDNYPRNYIFIAKKYNNIQGFTVFWGVPELKYLQPHLS